MYYSRTSEGISVSQVLRRLKKPQKLRLESVKSESLWVLFPQNEEIVIHQPPSVTI
jgi:hypothetical protein